MAIKTSPPYPVSRTSPQEAFSDEFSSSGSGIQSYLHVLRNRKATLMGAVIFCLAIAFFSNLTQRPVYQSSAELIMEPKDSRSNAAMGQPSVSPMSDPTFLLTQERLIRGPRLAERVLQKLEKPENRQPLLDCFSIRPSRKRKKDSALQIFSDQERMALIGAIQGSLSVRPVERGARLITISASAYNPQVVMRVANAAAEAYVQLNYESHMEMFRQNFGMISKSLTEVRQKIKTGEMASQKINSEIRLLEALQVYGEKHPLVVQLRSEIPGLTQKLRQGVQNLETMEISQRKDLRPLLMTPAVQLEDLLKIEADLYILKPILEQEVNSNREMYSSIFKRLQEVEVSGGGSVWMAPSIIEPAAVPSRPIRPNKKMNLFMGFFIGFFLGVGLAFFQEYLDSSIRSLDDVRNYLRLFPLGMVPQVEFSAPEGNREEGEGIIKAPHAFWLASDSDVPLYVSEAYRIIRTNLAFGSVDTSLKVLQVTSAVKGEGKTTTAANLAISLALAGFRTLLVDADLRRPSLHRILGLKDVEAGLSDSLTNGKSWESAIQPIGTPNLSVLTAGSIPPNPAELLSSKRMKAFIEEIKENFDMVILDSPPVISVADSAIIASRVDGTIFVSRSGFIPRHLCLQARSALDSINAKVVGCVLNGVQNEHQPYYYYRYYRHYGRYQKDGESAGSEGQPSNGPFVMLEKLNALREPLLVLLSRSWVRLLQFLKGRRSKKESESSVGSP